MTTYKGIEIKKNRYGYYVDNPAVSNEQMGFIQGKKVSFIKLVIDARLNKDTFTPNETMSFSGNAIKENRKHKSGAYFI